jgi:hypothetical protein
VTTTDRLLAALAALPTEPDEIARVFTELGIKGTRGSIYSCPVANYLNAEVGRSDISVGSSAYGGDGWWVSLPKHVQQFVGRFDCGEHPELIADGAE